MAQRTIVQLVDDLDGKTLRPGRGETVAFALDGTSFEIDLSARNAAALRAAMKRYVDAARPAVQATGSPRRRKSAQSGRGPSVKEVREWALTHGHAVSDRGRIPSTVMAAFRAST